MIILYVLKAMMLEVLHSGDRVNWLQHPHCLKMVGRLLEALAEIMIFFTLIIKVTFNFNLLSTVYSAPPSVN